VAISQNPPGAYIIANVALDLRDQKVLNCDVTVFLPPNNYVSVYVVTGFEAPEYGLPYVPVFVFAEFFYCENRAAHARLFNSEGQKIFADIY